MFKKYIIFKQIIFFIVYAPIFKDNFKKVS